MLLVALSNYEITKSPVATALTLMFSNPVSVYTRHPPRKYSHKKPSPNSATAEQSPLTHTNHSTASPCDRPLHHTLLQHRVGSISCNAAQGLQHDANAHLIKDPYTTLKQSTRPGLIACTKLRHRKQSRPQQWHNNSHHECAKRAPQRKQQRQR